MSDDREIRERLGRLERSNRRLKFVNTLAFICVAAAASTGAQQASKRTVEANKFVLRGTDGSIQAELSSDEFNPDPRLVFYDHSRKVKSVLATDRLIFSDWAGNARIALRPSSNGGTLILGDEDSWRLELSSASSEAGMYITKGYGSKAMGGGTPRAEDLLAVSIKKNGNGLEDGPAIELMDESGFRASLGRAVVVGKPTTSAASLRMYGKDGKVIWSAP